MRRSPQLRFRNRFLRKQDVRRISGGRHVARFYGDLRLSLHSDQLRAGPRFENAQTVRANQFFIGQARRLPATDAVALQFRCLDPRE